MRGGTHGGPGALELLSRMGGGSDGWGVLLLRLRRIWVASVFSMPCCHPRPLSWLPAGTWVELLVKRPLEDPGC